MDWHALKEKECTEKLQTDSQRGISQQRALELLEKYGPNLLRQQKKAGILRKFLAQFSDFMVITLLVAAAISALIAFFTGSGEYADPLMILVIVAANAVIGVFQESRAEHAIAALQKMTAPTCTVLREGKRSVIEAESLVCSDIILLEAGDLVPADARLISANNLKTEEAALTGESAAAEKNAQAVCKPDAPLAERCNMVYSGSVVVEGNAVAAVCATGMDTEMGKIAGLLDETDTTATPLQRRLARTGKILGIGALCICGVIFIMGIAQHTSVLDTFLLSVSLAVAAIPEGLPAVVTIVLALGVQRLAKHNAIIRRLPTVETLGSATVICSDKTGTLTQNKMTVTTVANASGELPLAGAVATNILQLAALCCNATAEQGDPTETAIVRACKEPISDAPRVFELPFDSVRKCMTTVHRMPSGKYKIICKGAPDMLMRQCAISSAQRDMFSRQNEALAERALRVIGVAFRETDTLPSKDSLEQKLQFCGFIGMMDPPREEVADAVAACRKAGITPVMITGDSAPTANSIAKKLGILHSGQTTLTGAELDAMSDRELFDSIKNVAVFARVTPEHKMRIVQSFKQHGEVVAMTGDGVNDAPALKAADIGCAMGKSGTDVAKGAADMILTDDCFSTIVTAVREGRGIYDNIRKVVHFLLSCNIGEILTIFLGCLFSLPSPLLPIQLLWVNLVTDSLPAIALGLEPTEPQVMHRRPAKAHSSMFSGGLGLDIALEGGMIGAFCLLAYIIGRSVFDITALPVVGRTMAFAVLSLSQLVHAFNVRSSRSLFAVGPFSNPRLCGAALLCAALQIAAVSLPFCNSIFDTVPLSPLQWAIVAAFSLLPLVIMETAKLISKKFHPNRHDS